MTDPAIQEKILSILDTNLSVEQISFDALDALVKQYGNRVYSNLIYLISHQEFEPTEAERHWSHIISHGLRMVEALKRPVDFRVALLDYFLNENGSLKNPMIIEFHLLRRAQESAIIDELTGLYNYRYFREQLELELKRAERYKTVLSLIILDLDDFKRFNDSYGHLAGNQALRIVADVMKQVAREVDIVFRFGGEEFVALLPQTNKEGALIFGERLLLEVQKHPFKLDEHHLPYPITFSAGISSFPSDSTASEELIAYADQALYLAKANGKNQVQMYSSERRAFDRIESVCVGNFHILSNELVPIKTKNISRNGILFVSQINVPLGSLIDLRLKLPRYHTTIGCKARVVRVEEIISGEQYEIGVQIAECTRQDQLELERYLNRKKIDLTNEQQN
jgi:diguanylate cyclase (GGDEF)-like protein